MKKLLIISVVMLTYVLYRKVKKRMKFDVDFTDVENCGI